MYLLLKITIISRNQGMFAHDGTVLNGEELPSGTKTHRVRMKIPEHCFYDKDLVWTFCVCFGSVYHNFTLLACAESILDDCNMKI